MILWLVIVAALSGLAMADYYLRHELTGKTRRDLDARGIDLSVEAALVAVREGDWDLLESLESVGIDLGAAAASGETVLMTAVRSGDVDGVNFLLRKENVIRSLEFRAEGIKPTALNLAVKGGEFAIAENLVAAGASLDELREDGLPLMIVAVNEDDRALFGFLIKQGFNVDDLDVSGHSALATAVAGKKIEWVTRLLAVGAEVNQARVSGESLLVATLRGGSALILRKLIDHGGAVNVKNESGDSAVMMAVEKKDREAISMLLQAGAEIDTFDAKGRSVVDRLIDGGDANLVEFFATQTDGGITDAWMVKVFEVGGLDLLEALLKKGGEVEAETVVGGRLLKRAVLNKDKAAVNLLLAYGAEAKGEVWDALASGSQVILEKLLVSGADANETLVLGVGSPLSLALRQRHYESASILLRYGADPSPKQVDGRSLLATVESRGDERAAALLREYGADGQEGENNDVEGEEK